MPQKRKSVYASIASDLVSKIKDGTYQNGTALPAERLLMDAYKVERTTVRRALEVLSDGGYIEKRAGVGSIVISTEENPALQKVVTKAQKPIAVQKSAEAIQAQRQQILFITPNLTALSGKSLLGKTYSAFEKLALEKGYDVCAVKSDPSELEKSAKKQSVYGAVMVEFPDEGALKYLKSQGIPVILCFGKSSEMRSVGLDNIGGMTELVATLFEKGHRNIAFLGSDEKSEAERERRIAFVRALEENGIEVNRELICTGGNDEKAGHDRFCEVYRRTRTKFTAVCAVSDEAAQGAIKAAQEYHLDVPGDISVTGFGAMDEKSGITSAFISPVVIAKEIFLSLMCEVLSGQSVGVETVLAVKVIGDTVSDINDKASSKRSMSDFLL